MAKNKRKKRRFRWDRLWWTLVTIWLAWLVISYIDIVIHNTEAQPVYLAWNLFAKLGQL
jgi:hypothetical protein